MKSIKLAAVAVLLLTASANLNAQIQKVNRTYGPAPTAPTWAPNAPKTVKYYYLPDIQTYYDVPSRRYIYYKDGAWVRRASLPETYRGYDLRNGQTIYLSDYKGNTPYTLFDKHKAMYKPRAWKPNGKDNGLHKGWYKNGKKGVKGIKYDNEDHDGDHDNGNGHHGKGKGQGKK